VKQYWERYAALLDARNPRERALIFFMVLAVVWSLLSVMLLDPLVANRKRLNQEANQQQVQVQELQTRIETVLSVGRIDPDAATRVRMAGLKQKLEQSRVALQNVQQSLVPPEKMARLLEDVLTQNRHLKLVSLKTLPVSDVLEMLPDAVAPQAREKKPAGPVIFKHGVEITVAGSYAELTQYLETMEKLPWRMIWGKAEMRVEEYPLVTLSITLYTLSMDKTWLSV
jgi:MSHA biogenesis protein MshJ